MLRGVETEFVIVFFLFCLFRVRGNRDGAEGIPDPLVAQIRIQPGQGRPFIGGPAFMKVAQLATPGPAVQPAERASDGYDNQNQQPACCFEKYSAHLHTGGDYIAVTIR